MKTSNNPIICEVCGITCKNSHSYNGHKLAHHSDFPPPAYIRCCCVYTKRETTLQHLPKIQSNLRYCKQCNSIILGNVLGKKQFCNSSCSAKFNNSYRISNGYIITAEHKQKTSTSHKQSIKRKLIHEQLISNIKYPDFANKSKSLIMRWSLELPHFETIYNSSGVFTLFYTNNCKHCGTLFNHHRRQKYCNNCNSMYIHGRTKYLFNFNVFDYPHLFDLAEIQRVGFYQRNAKDKHANIYRLTRDHKVTVNDAIRHNYDQYYITHPLNCAILPWIENNSKNTTSSITYEELVELVESYVQVDL